MHQISKFLKSLTADIRAVWRDPRFRELLWFCAPALLVGFVLRALLTAQMPFGYVQFDSADFLLTPYRFLSTGDTVIHGKKSFLVPILYLFGCLPPKIPALITLAFVQHLLGLVTTVLAGALVRFWFSFWKWLIVPITLFFAASPVLLWFEHALLAESVYIFCAVALALAGTLFVRRPNGKRLAWLLVALFFTAGARPEGKLFLPFGLLLVLFACWGDWKNLGKKMAWFCLAAILIAASTRSRQAGQLLYATMLPLSPDQSKVAPEFSAWIRPVRDEVRAKTGDLAVKLNTLEKQVGTTAKWYLESKGAKNPDVNSLCEKLALEAMKTSPEKLPLIAWQKFLLTTKTPTTVGYNDYTLHEKQADNFLRGNWMRKFSPKLTGQFFADKNDALIFSHTHYAPSRWYDALEKKWNRLTLKWRPRKPKTAGLDIPSLPNFFTLSFAGMVLALAWPSRMRIVHAAWLAALALVWFGVMLTGVINPRYRFIFEPFCVIYLLLGIDVLASATALLIAHLCHSELCALGFSEKGNARFGKSFRRALGRIWSGRAVISSIAPSARV